MDTKRQNGLKMPQWAQTGPLIWGEAGDTDPGPVLL